MLVDDLESKLGFLLSFYLRMRHSLARYDRYFETTDPERMQERIAMLEHEIAQRLRARQGGEDAHQGGAGEAHGALRRRRSRTSTLVDAQTETVQEVLQLLRDQSYSMRDPRSITEQLDGLVVLRRGDRARRARHGGAALPRSGRPARQRPRGPGGRADGDCAGAPAGAVPAASRTTPTSTSTPKRKKVVQ